MRADPIHRAIDEDLVRVLYAQGPIAFFSHWFSMEVPSVFRVPGGEPHAARFC
jgi:hypothetical protein